MFIIIMLPVTINDSPVSHKIFIYLRSGKRSKNCITQQINADLIDKLKCLLKDRLIVSIKTDDVNRWINDLSFVVHVYGIQKCSLKTYYLDNVK